MTTTETASGDGPRDGRRTSRLHRFLIVALASLLTLLFLWLLGFVVEDIGDLEGPSYEDVEAELVPAALRDELKQLETERKDLTARIEGHEQVQAILRQSLDQSQSAMNQLIQIHRLNLDKNVRPTTEEQQALAESQRLFLAKQQEFQSANEEIAGLSEERRRVESRIEALNQQKEADSERARELYEDLLKVHRLRVAALKLAVVVPVLLLAASLVVRWRTSPYAPILWALLIAAFWRVGLVMHAYFPSAWFRYIAIAAGIGVVGVFLVQLIRTGVRPKRDWLLKQYREAYNRRRCPVCDYPIRLGALRDAVWTAKGPRGPQAPAADEPQERPYVCPSCGEALFESCAQCGAVRHSRLPYCDACGSEKVMASV